jgi:YegS/Rv2252/BmrU family lipid kinase
MQGNTTNWHIILNPVAGKKKAVKLWRKLEPALTQHHIHYTLHKTAYRNHAIKIAEMLVREGVKNVIIIGGDGTANEVINGIFRQSINAEGITVAMLSAGTGNDWVRTIGKHTSIENIIASLRNKKTYLHDIGVIQYKKDNVGQKRYFINIAGLGFDGYVAKKITESNRILQGTKLQYWFALLQSLFVYKHHTVQFIVDGKEMHVQTLSAAVGICKYNGGGMMQLPAAQYNDGLLDGTIITNMSKCKMVISLPKLTDGSFTAMKEVKQCRGRTIEITSEAITYVEADGEFLGELPVHITLQKEALQVLRWE